MVRCTLLASVLALGALLVHGLGRAAPAPEGPKGPIPSDGKLPSGPPPMQGLARLDKDRVIIRTGRVTYVTKVVATPDGGRRIFTEQVMQTIEQAYPFSQVRGHDLRGKALTEKELARLLGKEIVVMVSADGKPVDPLHLRVLRGGTPVLVPPMPPAPIIGPRRGPPSPLSE
jgi:hypothetical protein